MPEKDAAKLENAEKARELSRTDRKYLDLASEGLSPEEIVDKVPGDASAAMIALRIKQLLAARSGWLTVAEESALHLHDLQRIKKKAEDMLSGEEGNRALTGVAAIMQQIGQRIDLAASRSDERMGLIRKAQAREFAAALEMSYDRVVSRLAKKYPEVDKIVLREMFGEEFSNAVARIDALVEEEEL